MKEHIKKQLNALNHNHLEYGILTLLTMGVFLLLMSMLLGVNLTDINQYNTYALQADSWRQGRLDLGENYSHLELAIYNGKYYCSFPPFPSYLLFPLTYLFGSNTPDYFIMLLINLATTIYLYRLALKLGLSGQTGMLLTLFVTIGANTLYIMMHPWVWFLAQMLCFLTALMAIYYAVNGKGGLSLFCWACSVGCRPMQAVFLPVLLFLLYQQERKKDAETPGVRLVLRRFYWAIPTGILALSYMLLNYLRFGSIMEFGHNYLPEFTEAKFGQFHPEYLKTNLPSLVRLPQFNEEGQMYISHFGDLSFFIVCPIAGVALVALIYSLWKREKSLIIPGLLITALSMIYLFILAMHKTLGGWHFGNRYVIDILPYTFVFLTAFSAKHPKWVKYYIPFLTFGIGLNVIGTVIVYQFL